MNAKRLAVGLGVFLLVMIIFIGYVVPLNAGGIGRLGSTLQILLVTVSIFTTVYCLWRRSWAYAIAMIGLFIASIDPSEHWTQFVGMGLFFIAYFYGLRHRQLPI